jgi:hypothetical protein
MTNLSKEHKRKISVSLKKNKYRRRNLFTKGHSGYWLGKKRGEDFSRKMSEIKKGVPVPLERRKRISASLTGRKASPETVLKLKRRVVTEKTRQAISEAIRGEKHWRWKGTTPLLTRLRNSARYSHWRNAVFERDDYTCQHCRARGVRLNADHIKPFALFPEIRFDLENGRTLCVDCHKKTPTWGPHLTINKTKLMKLWSK